MVVGPDCMPRRDHPVLVVGGDLELKLEAELSLDERRQFQAYEKIGAY